MTDDGLTAFSDDGGEVWRWHWRAPWTAEVVGPTTHRSEAAALAAGRKWLAGQQPPGQATAARRKGGATTAPRGRR